MLVCFLLYDLQRSQAVVLLNTLLIIGNLQGEQLDTLSGAHRDGHL
jgi:hypothetical protein